MFAKVRNSLLQSYTRDSLISSFFFCLIQDRNDDSLVGFAAKKLGGELVAGFQMGQVLLEGEIANTLRLHEDLLLNWNKKILSMVTKGLVAQESLPRQWIDLIEKITKNTHIQDKGVGNIDQVMEEVVLDDGDSDGENAGLAALDDYKDLNQDSDSNHLGSL